MYELFERFCDLQAQRSKTPLKHDRPLTKITLYNIANAVANWLNDNYLSSQ